MRSFRFWMPMLGFALLATCSHDRADSGACGPGALGTARIQKVSLGSGHVPDLLAEGEVVLTFDDGPHPTRTPRILDLLDDHCVQATFFLMGTEAEAHPSEVREIKARGHTLGGHSWDHPYLSKRPVPEAVANIETGMEAIRAATGEEVLMFRFPFIDTSPALSDAVYAAGYLDVTVNVDGADWLNQPPEESVARILSMLDANGRRGIVLLHDPFPDSDRRARKVIEALKENDYRVVALQPDE